MGRRFEMFKKASFTEISSSSDSGFADCTLPRPFRMTIKITISTLPRAIFHISISLIYKFLSALLTLNSSTLITPFTLSRRGHKDFSTFFTIFAFGNKMGNFSIANKMLIMAIKFYFFFAMTSLTQTNKIIKMISLFVIIKQLIWFHMMNKFGGGITQLARIIISLKCFLSLCLPILASILRMPTKPTRIVFARHKSCFKLPSMKTNPVAKVGGFYSTRLFLNWFFTIITNYLNSLPTLSNPINLLPFTIAIKSAKMQL